MLFASFSIAFGVVLLLYLRLGLLALVWTIGIYAVVLGVVVIGKAWVLALSSRTLASAR